jgi:predicted cupin superfamily sugar epimerase
MQQMDISQIINNLGLKEHPEGGYFFEVYKSSKIYKPNLENSENRNLATSIYFLLKSGQVSKFHQLKSDEIWYFHSGSPLNVFLINEKGDLKTSVLGNTFELNYHPQIIIPAGTIFGAEVILPNSYSFIGCAVIPGFEFADFKLMKQDELLSIYPNYKDLIIRLT